MIRYTIKCKNHCKSEFEGQFPDTKSFTKQKKQGMIQCPMCDTLNLTFSKIRTKGPNENTSGRP
tara:strand:+ start:1498 stop:1689 length:192 start_codon:yes stop_codon:yes gene_type:complete